MTIKETVSAAVKEAEKEKQEAEINRIKAIVKSYLEKIDGKEKERVVLNKEIQSLKDDLDDLKAGRLDKIEERQEKDPEHQKYTLIIVRRIEKEFIPFQPWRSPWIVEWRWNNAFSPFGVPMITSGTGTIGGIDISTNFTSTGTNFQNFTSGTYDINGHIINL